MTVYQYIAESNPYAAIGICRKYGYSTTGVTKKADVAVCLQKLVQAEGELAFRDLMNMHPDKDVILELFAPAAKNTPAFSNMDGTGDRTPNYWDLKANDHYMNFNGAQVTSSSTFMNLTVVAATLILGLAIISNK